MSYCKHKLYFLSVSHQAEFLSLFISLRIDKTVKLTVFQSLKEKKTDKKQSPQDLVPLVVD